MSIYHPIYRETYSDPRMTERVNAHPDRAVLEEARARALVAVSLADKLESAHTEAETLALLLAREYERLESRIGLDAAESIVKEDRANASPTL